MKPNYMNLVIYSHPQAQTQKTKDEQNPKTYI